MERTFALGLRLGFSDRKSGGANATAMESDKPGWNLSFSHQSICESFRSVPKCVTRELSKNLVKNTEGQEKLVSIIAIISNHRRRNSAKELGWINPASSEPYNPAMQTMCLLFFCAVSDMAIIIIVLAIELPRHAIRGLAITSKLDFRNTSISIAKSSVAGFLKHPLPFSINQQ